MLLSQRVVTYVLLVLIGQVGCVRDLVDYWNNSGQTETDNDSGENTTVDLDSDTDLETTPETAPETDQAPTDSESGSATGCADTGEPPTTDSNPEIDTGTDSATDDQEACPVEMAYVPSGTPFCIDLWEASRSDALPDDAGEDESRATSRPLVIPWYVNSVDTQALAKFEAACNAAEKRLCRPDEWTGACVGLNNTTYVFGNEWDRNACNCVDSFCDEYCDDNNIESGECNTDINCGYLYDCFHVQPTGSFGNCTNEFGTFDINGNVWEVVPSATDPRGFEVRGGAYNCANAASRLQCHYNAQWETLYAGFRCCKDADFVKDTDTGTDTY